MKVCLSFVLSVILIKPLSAQFNDSTNHHIGYLASGTLNNANGKRFIILNNILKFSIRKKDLVLNSSNSWIYGRQEKNLINNDFSSALDFNVYKTWQHFNYWGLGTYDRSYSLKIRNRFQLGIGVAYNIVEKEHFIFNVSDGIIYEQSNLIINDSTNRYNQTLRNSFRIKYKLTWAGKFTLDGTHFLQNSLSAKTDYIINSNSSLFISIRKGINITGSVIYNRLNFTNRENLLTTFGISMERYF
jgi:hypothetical protein